MEKAIPVETCLGYLLYRDAVHLASIKSDGVDWFLSGKINGHNVTKNPKGMKWIPFEIAFSCVQNIFTVENTTDLNYMIAENEADPACFHIINDSFWIRPNPKSRIDVSDLKHYRLKTLDSVMHIVADNYTFSLAQ